GTPERAAGCLPVDRKTRGRSGAFLRGSATPMQAASWVLQTHQLVGVTAEERLKKREKHPALLHLDDITGNIASSARGYPMWSTEVRLQELTMLTTLRRFPQRASAGRAARCPPLCCWQ